MTIENPRRPKPPGPAPAGSSRRRLRVLVVDGHPATLEVLELFLEMLGQQAEFAPDAGAALAKVQAREFDVLLSEMHLPGRDGCELLRELVAQGRRPPRAVSMGSGWMRLEAEHSQAAGFDAHLVKPFRPEELEAAFG